MVIFDTGTEPPAIQAVVDRLLDTVKTSGGTPGQVDRWGRRPFAYEVKHKREGYYVLVEFAGEVQTVNDLDRMLTLADEVLRHKVIRLPEKAVKRVGGGRGGRSAPPPSAPLPERPRPDAPLPETAAPEPVAAAEPEPAPEAVPSAEAEEAVEPAAEPETVEAEAPATSGAEEATVPSSDEATAEEPAAEPAGA
jgi:small subunit ribosomal protein S6